MFKNMKIGLRIAGGFGIVIFISLLIILGAIKDIRTVSNSTQILYQGPYTTLNDIWTIRNAINKLEGGLYKSITHIGQDDIQDVIKQNEAEVSTLAAALEKIKALYTFNNIEEGMAMVTEMEAVLQSGVPVQKEMSRLILAGQEAEALYLLQNDSAKLFERAYGITAKMSAHAGTSAEKFATEAQAVSNQVMIIDLLLLTLSLLISLFIASRITKGITRPIDEISEAALEVSQGNLSPIVDYESKNKLGVLADSMRITVSSISEYIDNINVVLDRMAAGDMTVTVDMDYKGDYQNIKVSMERIASSLNNTLGSISNVTEQVTDAAGHVAQSANELSESSAQQASTISHLAEIIEDISSQIKQNSDNTEKANAEAKEAGKLIGKGNEEMGQLVSAMDKISLSAQQIGKIIKTIDDIAFQTNILALNAAVEAARAGAAGKGFAVVADEVRNLASKSADAAKETTTLIETSISSVEEGGRIVAHTSETLAKVALQAESTNILIDKISEAGKAQAISIVQVSRHVEEISAIVATNSSSAEESAAASEELNGQAQVLEGLIDHFRLSKGR